MAKSFKILQNQLHAKMTPEQLAESDKLFQKMLADIDKPSDSDFEPDLVAWLRTQNQETKNYINGLVRNAMNWQRSQGTPL